MKHFLFVVFLILSVVFGFFVKQNYKKEFVPLNIEQELKRVATPQFLNEKIESALKSGNIEDAKAYAGIAKRLNIAIKANLAAKIESENSGVKKAIRGVKDFAKGFISGKSTNISSLSGSVASDFTLIGDLRDGYKEGRKYLNNQNYDKFLLGISLVGIALTASEFATMGATVPLKGGASVLKSAYKSGKITAKFGKVLEKKLAKSVDFKLIKQADFSSLKNTKKSLKAIAKSVDPKPFKSLFKELNRVRKNSSLTDSVELLKYVESEKDLQKIAKISAKYKKDTKGVFKILGKRVLRGGKMVVKLSKELIFAAIGFILSSLGFLFSIVSFMFRRR